MTDMTDPRVAEFRAALVGVSEISDEMLLPVDPDELGDTPAANRYRNALGPYCEFYAETTPAAVRQIMRETLHETTLIPKRVIDAAFDQVVRL